MKKVFEEEAVKRELKKKGLNSSGAHSSTNKLSPGEPDKEDFEDAA